MFVKFWLILFCPSSRWRLAFTIFNQCFFDWWLLWMILRLIDLRRIKPKDLNRDFFWTLLFNKLLSVFFHLKSICIIFSLLLLLFLNCLFSFILLFSFLLLKFVIDFSLFLDLHHYLIHSSFLLLFLFWWHWRLVLSNRFLLCSMSKFLFFICPSLRALFFCNNSSWIRTCFWLGILFCSKKHYRAICTVFTSKIINFSNNFTN